MTVDREIGQGESGRVYAARTGDGTAVALKVFDGMSISRRALQTSAARLATGGWPAGVMPLVDFDYENRPAFHATPLLADGEARVPRSLQYQIDAHPGHDTLAIIRGIADALAAMHRKRVAHANLKPGNVFLSDDGDVLLADWALGNMPGVGHMRFTDALLYQPPAQLRSPEDYLHEEGYRWDVYAFGTLAYRLMSGRFPRCDDVFSTVVPAQGTTRRDDINADLEKIAENLEAHPAVTWPDEPNGKMEAGIRVWILRCLELDPQERPASMIDVAAGLARVEQDIETHLAHLALLDARRRANRRALQAYGLFALAACAAIGTGMLWVKQTNALRETREINAREMARMEQDVANAEAAKREAAEAERTARENAARAAGQQEKELQRTLAMLQASRELGDRLFAWSIEQDARQLPPLDGRTARLRALRMAFEQFLAAAADVEPLAHERARAHLHLAEIALAAGEMENARTRLVALESHLATLQEDPALPFRMARNIVLLGLLEAEHGEASATETLQLAKRRIDALDDGDRALHLSAIVGIHLAVEAMEEEAAEASIDDLLAATRILNELAERRPESGVLRFEIARAHLATAGIFDAGGRSAEAMAARELATAELRRLLESRPSDPALMLELAGSVGTMAEAAIMTGDIAAAVTLSREAAGLLETILAESPGNPTANSRLAAQLGLQAGVLRDGGDAAEAIAKYREGKQRLDSVRQTAPDDRMATYRLALLTWELGRMVGTQGDRDEEITMLRDAAALLDSSARELPPGSRLPNIEQVRISSAYLHGDLGHALEGGEDTPGAKAAFTESVRLWTALAEAEPEREEFADGLAWSQRRLAELGD